MSRSSVRGAVRDVSLERIRILFEQARLRAVSDPPGARRRALLAFGISKRTNVRIPRDLAGFFCRGCGAFFSSGSFRVRLDPVHKRSRWKCLACGRERFRPYVRAKKSGRLSKSSRAKK